VGKEIDAPEIGWIGYRKYGLYHRDIQRLKECYATKASGIRFSRDRPTWRGAHTFFQDSRNVVSPNTILERSLAQKKGGEIE